MPGVYGFCATAINPDSILANMARAMVTDELVSMPPFISDPFAASCINLGHTNRSNSPAHSGDITVWVEGEVYNLKELCVQFNLEEQSDFEDAIIETFKQNLLTSFLGKVDGYFCAVLYDKRSAQVKLVTDRYGMRLLYYYMENGQFAWANEVKGLLALNGINKAIDSTSFDCFMDLGYLSGQRTWFEKIKLIAPATILTFDIQKNSIYEETYWKWSHIKPSSLTFDEAVNELGRVFIQSVKRRFSPDEKIGVTLSGGLDSRAILAAIDHLYPDYQGYAFTFGISGCDDIKIAKQVVSQTKWIHREFHLSDENWFKSRGDSVWNTDGMLDIKHMHGGEFFSEFSKNIDVNLNGYLGDAIFGGSYLINASHKNTRINLDVAKQYYGDHIDQEWLKSEFYDINHIDPFLFMNRGRRFVNMGIVNGQSFLDQRMPFFDNECVDLIFSLPDEYRLNNKLYSVMLQTFFPKFFRDIPWQKTGRPAGELHNTIARRIINRTLKLYRYLFGLKETYAYSNYAAWIRGNGFSEKLNALLESSEAKYLQIKDIDLKDKYLIPHLDNKNIDNSNEILRLVTIEIYLRKLSEYDGFKYK